MTIDEAIQRYEEAVQWEQYSMRSENINKAAEHRQLAEWLKELKRLRAQEPCEDAVSREMIMRHYDSGEYKHVNHISRNGLLDYIEQLPSVTPKLAECEDAVSREAIESILYELYEVCTNMDELVHCMDDNLRKLPSVTPERKKGKWISHYVGIDEDDYGWDCSECGEWFVMDELYHYCPKCGAKME